jgi:hypothetical protein
MPDEVTEDIWEWLFVDLSDDEDVNECILAQSRWIWMGRLGLGEAMSPSPPFPARPASSNPNTAGPLVYLN